jgi:hypothetical protein
MGEAELNISSRQLKIHSVFYFYGDAATAAWAEQIAQDISRHWNAPAGMVKIRGHLVDVRFMIEGIYEPGVLPETVWYNNHPRYNYFRIEPFSPVHVSFVDGIKCNTGYFKLDNLDGHSTTAAHEYGHTLGLHHPANLDIRGKGQPGIMYPRGTICDPAFQYDPAAQPLAPGGTMNPFTRKVLQQDIDNLRLHRLFFDKKGFCTVGDFSGVYHDRHLPPA